MKHYIFNAEKAIRNGAAFNWAKFCDGKEVIDGKIGDTKFNCTTETNLRAWCDEYSTSNFVTNYDALRSNSALLEKIATNVGLPYDLAEYNDKLLSAAIHFYNCKGVCCNDCPFYDRGCMSAKSLGLIVDWLNSPANKRE